MITCICNNVSENTIIEIVEDHAIHDLKGLQEKISICNQCCMCENYINNLISLVTQEVA